MDVDRPSPALLQGGAGQRLRQQLPAASRQVANGLERMRQTGSLIVKSRKKVYRYLKRRVRE